MKHPWNREFGNIQEHDFNMKLEIGNWKIGSSPNF